MKRGQQKEIPAFMASPTLHVVGAYNRHSAQVSYLTVERKNKAIRLLPSLEQLLAEYPSQSLILVMDNASYHHSAKVQAFLKYWWSIASRYSGCPSIALN